MPRGGAPFLLFDGITNLTPVRRLLAVGLETGEISIYSNLIAASGKWEVTSSIPIGYDLFTPTPLRAGLNFDCRVAHVDQIHRLAWQSTDEPTERRLASCSEDGTLKILVVQVDV